MDCHIDNGRGSDKDAPLLAGQELTFLIQQTLAFKSGVRKFPFMMDDAYRGLTADELSATAHFFAAQDANAPPPGKKKWRRG
jgi:cytochrome c553